MTGALTRQHPRTVHHYTDAAGFNGILTSRSVWATDIRFLNDSSELELALRSLKVHFDAAREAAGGSRNAFPDRRDFIGNQLFGPDARHRCYVACFCEQGDLLSQWRAYGAGAGYSIEFRSDLLPRHDLFDEDLYEDYPHFADDDEHEESELGPPMLSRVTYGTTSKSAEMLRWVEEWSESDWDFDFEPAEAQAHKALIALASIKHEAFLEEAEWRLVKVSTPHSPAAPQFRESRFGVTPYVLLAIELRAIVGVHVSPGVHAELRRSGAEELLAAAGIRDIPVRISDAPYRT